MSLRAVPMLHGRAPSGKCRWCGDAILHPAGHKRAGEVNSRRNWHPDCVTDYKLHAFPDAQKRFVRKRDGEVCSACGGAPLAWRRVTSTGWNWDRDLQCNAPYCELERIVALELEHTTPLWSVQHLEPRERIRFYGPENLTLMCEPCHDAKTAREAGERAKDKRLRDDHQLHLDVLAGRAERPPGSIQNRGFDKTLTKKMNGKVEKRA